MTVRDFDRLYAGDPDPWQVATSWYEQRKIGVVLATLRRPTYAFAWDAGCGTGELTAALSRRARRILATDASPEALALARERLTDVPGVEVRESRLPETPAPLAEPPDLVVLSEVLYYVSEADRRLTYERLDALAHPDADLVVVHWGPRADDAASSGLSVFNEATTALNALGWGRLVTHTDTEFFLGLFSRDVPDEVGGRDADPVEAAEVEQGREREHERGPHRPPADDLPEPDPTSTATSRSST